ncbi:MAG: hypothetical protein IPM29_16360 [Planctomycetes bacterium]|nr:hypothetical protein [Planctomycetota bacterium]
MALPFPAPEIDEWVPVAVLGDPRATVQVWGPRLELAAWPDLGGGGPSFVHLDLSGRFSQVLLGRIAARGMPLQYVAVKLARDNFRETSSGLAAAHVDNAELAAGWEREKMTLAMLRGQGAVAMLLIDDGGPLAAPLVHCRHMRQTFRPIDPRTGQPLQLCRDPGVLELTGLPHPEQSLARYLYDPDAELAAGEPDDGASETLPRFFTWSEIGSPAQRIPALAQGREIFRSWRALFRPSLPADAQGALERTFACWTCPEQSACYRQGEEASARLTPLTFYGGPAIVTEALPLRVDELADLLGGARLADVFPAGFGPEAKGREILLHGFAAAVGERPPWVVARGAPGFATEVLARKLELVHQIARALRSFHESTSRPHLDLSPGSLMARVTPPRGVVDAPWDFEVQLVDVGCQVRQRLAPRAPETVPVAWLPAAGHDRQYAPEWLDDAEGRAPTRARMTCNEPDKQGAIDRIRMRAELTPPFEVQRGDFVRLRVDEGVPRLRELGHDLVGTVMGVEGRLVRFEVHAGEPLAHRADLPIHFDADVTFFRRLHAPCDLHALALLGFRILLTNEHLDPRAALELGRRLIATLRHRILEGQRRDAGSIETMARTLLREQIDLADRSHAVYFGTDRPLEPDDGPAPELWDDALLTLLRIGTFLPAYGVCQHHLDCDLDAPATASRRAEALLRDLVDRVHAALPWARPRAQELVELCDLLSPEGLS